MSEQIEKLEGFIVKTVEVVITKRIRVYLAEDLATPEVIEGWCRCLWDIDGIDDIAKHAAIKAAQEYAGYTLDGLGRLEDVRHKATKQADTWFKELDENIESEIIED